MQLAERSRRRIAGAGRAEILTVARQLFMARGYRAVSTRDIAAAVGMTQPALYHHFSGKEALYVAVLEDELARRSAEMWEVARLEVSPSERLATIAERIATRSRHDLSQMFHDLRTEVSGGTRARIGAGFRDAMLRPMVVILDDMIARGAIGSPEVTGLSVPEMAMFVLGVIRMLTEVESGPARGRQRSPGEVGQITVRLVTLGLAESRTP